MARRLSYFLWASLPDEELLKAARAGKLQDDAVLRAQVRRMMKDPKIEAFSREFFGQWLRYRDYLAKDTIPANTFPGYDAVLREAMFEEPTRLITHLIQQDEPVDELLHSDATFVNETLARFYGGEIEKQFRQFAGENSSAGTHPRSENGMASRRGLAEHRPRRAVRHAGDPGEKLGGPTNEPGEAWVLGRASCARPALPAAAGRRAGVAEVGEGKRQDDSRNARRSTRRIRSCAMCHVHFDGLGLTMEGFDAIGRARTKDLAGRDGPDRRAVAGRQNGRRNFGADRLC